MKVHEGLLFLFHFYYAGKIKSNIIDATINWPDSVPVLRHIKHKVTSQYKKKKEHNNSTDTTGDKVSKYGYVSWNQQLQVCPSIW